MEQLLASLLFDLDGDQIGAGRASHQWLASADLKP